jgi:imidazolonepropionase
MMILLKNISQLLHFDETQKNDILENAYLIIKDENIYEYGKMENLPKYRFDETINIENRIITPGFIDSHTHLIFAGSRSNEFELRANGATYEQILESGGGINNTVQATRETPFFKLLTSGKDRLEKALSFGITTIEIKSGYGLDQETEIKILEVIKQLKKLTNQKISSTYLGAHIIPKEYKENREEYISLITQTMLKTIKENDLAENIDVFIENNAYSINEAEIIIKKAIEYGFNIKLHTEQLSHKGGTQLGIKYNALSVDHLEFLNNDDIEALKNSNTVATLLPIAVLFLNKNNFVNAHKLIKNGVRVALATDFNPGSANSLNMNLVISLAVLKSKMTVLEAIKAVTINAAYALNMQKEIGSLEKNKKADLIIHDTSDYKDLAYQMGVPLVKAVFINGQKRCFKK